MLATFRDWFNTLLIITGFVVVGVIALSVQVQQCQDQKASDAALGQLGAAHAPGQLRSR